MFRRKILPNTTPVPQLPVELWSLILSFCSQPENANVLAALMLTSKHHRKIALSPNLSQNALHTFGAVEKALLREVAPYYVKVKKEQNKLVNILTKESYTQRLEDLNQLKQDIIFICSRTEEEMQFKYMGFAHRNDENSADESRSFRKYPFCFPICIARSLDSIFNYGAASELIGKTTGNVPADRHMLLMFRLVNELVYAEHIKDAQYRLHLQKMMEAHLSSMRIDALSISSRAILKTLERSANMQQRNKAEDIKDFPALDTIMGHMFNIINHRLELLTHQKINRPKIV